MKKVYKKPVSRFLEFNSEEVLIIVSGGDAASTNGTTDISNSAALSKERQTIDFSDEESIW